MCTVRAIPWGRIAILIFGTILVLGFSVYIIFSDFFKLLEPHSVMLNENWRDWQIELINTFNNLSSMYTTWAISSIVGSFYLTIKYNNHIICKLEASFRLSILLIIFLLCIYMLHMCQEMAIFSHYIIGGSLPYFPELMLRTIERAKFVSLLIFIFFSAQSLIIISKEATK